MAFRYKLETDFYAGEVVHTTYRSDLTLRVRRMAIKTRWCRDEQLGTGAFGVVWREENQSTKELRAVKMIPKQHFKNFREVDAMAELQDHPELFILFLGWFEDEHSIYIAMECIENGDLSQYIEECAEDAMEDADQIATQLLEGLVVLHARGICHRDLKPQNILMASTSPIWVKISDFGISKRTTGTSLRTSCGTLCYKAPEQLGMLPNHMRSRGGYTTAVDLWALGAVIHQVLTSEIPFLDTYYHSESMFETSAVPEIDVAHLVAYCNDTKPFPEENLETHHASKEAIDFVKSLMVVNPSNRVSAAEALNSPWLLRIDPPSTDCATGPQLLRTEFQLLDMCLSEKEAYLLYFEEDVADVTHLLDGCLVGSWPYTAAEMGYLEVVKIAVKLYGIEQEYSSHDLLFVAARRGQVTVMEFLLNRGAIITPVGREDSTLAAAAGSGHINAMTLLLNHGASINMNISSADETYKTPLQAAASGGYLDAMKMLLNRGADVDAGPSEYEGLTAVQGAAKGGHLDALKLLLQHDADVTEDAGHLYGLSAVQAAALGGHLDVFKLLLAEGANINQVSTNNGGRTALQAAASKGHLDMCKLLLAEGADVNHMPDTQGGRTAMQGAAEGGHIGVMKLLLDNGCSTTEPAAWRNGLTALQATAKGGHLEALQLLVDYDANINQEPGCEGGRTALQAAAEAGHLDILEFLLYKDANIEAEPAHHGGVTAIQAATRSANLRALRMLLDHGVDDIDRKFQSGPGRESGLSPLESAVRCDNLPMVKLLLEGAARVTDTAMNDASGTPRILRALRTASKGFS